MKYHPASKSTPLSPGLARVLDSLRQDDNFDAQRYADAKARVLNAYMRSCGLKSCVVAVSGGVDSALVLALTHHAMKHKDSPIEKIVPVLLPVFTPGAATNQDVATARGHELCGHLNLAPVEIDLTPAHQSVKSLVEASLGAVGQNWAAGQLVAYQRTPALYYVTSLLSEQGLPGILVGTTNESEGAYLGYFGKASDGLVDVQLISDAYKYRVFEVAAHLGVCKSILEAVPTGDMFDGRVDEDVFGAPYDFVELFLRTKKNPLLVAARMHGLEPEDLAQYEEFRARVEALHGYNAHKYLGRSPAVHLDLTDVSFPGSWNYSVWRP